MVTRDRNGLHVIYDELMRIATGLLFLASQSRFLQPRTSAGNGSTLSTYSPSLNYENPLSVIENSSRQCAPLKLPPSDQCSHAHSSCPKSQTFLSITYLQSYFCAAPAARPIVFLGLVLWLAFLFSFIGITASDFFCPNLATISDIFGLDENVAGVTLLAFGNGSPDLFSTLSAMKSDSGSLAIGELLGAASFIVSIVAGSMCIVKPFRVNPSHFIRDVSFFTIAVVVLLLVLIDGVIRKWEAASLVALYLTYVTVVVAGTWWEKRQSRRRNSLEEARSVYRHDSHHDISIFVDNEPYTDDPDDVPSQPMTPSRQRAHSAPGRPPTGAHVHSNSSFLRPSIDPSQTGNRPVTVADTVSLGQMGRSQSSYFSHSRPRHAHTRSQHLPSFSILGALEFRSVVNALQKESNLSALDIFDSPVTPVAGGHYHAISRSLSRGSIRSRSRSSSTSAPSASRSPLPSPSLHPSAINDPFSPFKPDNGVPLLLSPVSPPEQPLLVTSSLDTSTHAHAVNIRESRRRRLAKRAGKILHVLFPTLLNLQNQSPLGIIAAVVAAPAVFLLTVTLPVVTSSSDYTSKNSEEHPQDGVLMNYEDSPPNSGASSLLINITSPGDEGPDEEDQLQQERLGWMVDEAEEEVEEELHGTVFNKWLTAAQLVLGPVFSVLVVFGATGLGGWGIAGAALAGSCVAGFVLWFAKDGKNQYTRVALCIMGFVVSLVWIAAIADEVVLVLNTFGLIFGLSDAIIGLTIFAIGNSLADFVANFTVARLGAPIMGYSACFGGPMLNILLGIGLSGTLVVSQTGKPYSIEFTPTLLSSSIGLLFLLVSTALYVPWNGFHLDKRWGIFLLCSYIVIMTVNILVEIFL